MKVKLKICKVDKRKKPENYSVTFSQSLEMTQEEVESFKRLQGRLEGYIVKVMPWVEKVNFMSGEVFLEDPETSYYCSPSSETYWSM